MNDREAALDAVYEQIENNLMVSGKWLRFSFYIHVDFIWMF